MRPNKKITLSNGEAYPILFGPFAFAILSEWTNLSFTQIDERINGLLRASQGSDQGGEIVPEHNDKGLAVKGADLIFIYDLIRAGFYTGCQMERAEFPYNTAQLSTLLDEEAIGDAFKAYVDSLQPVEEKKRETSRPARRKIKA